jgi:hypothetical protein
MKRKPNVRPPVPGHPDRRQTSPAGQAPDPVAAAVQEATEELFIQRGGERRRRMLKLLDETMDVYEQDVRRAKGNEENFKWRVKPSEMLRLRREVSILEAEIEKLMDECYQMAKAMIQELMNQPRQQAARPDTETRAASAPVRQSFSEGGSARPPQSESEVAARQPTAA